jgi:lipopolysaccharide heptosyltransferase I
MRRSRRNLADIEPRRVCLIKPSSLGDVVHALPTLAALRDRWPSARFAWVVNSGLRGLLDGHPLLDEVIPFDRARVGLSPSGLAAFASFLRSLRRERFDVAIDLQGLLRSGLMTAATRAPVRVGLSSAREGATRFYTHRVADSPQHPHAVDRLLAVARAFGAPIDPPRFLVALSPTDRDWARNALAEVSRPRIVLNVGARWETKRWPPSSFAAVARRAVEERGAGLIAVGAPEDRPLVDRLRANLGPWPLLDLCGRTSLPRLAAIAAECDLFLSNDTGPLHLAAAAGARVLGIYTCTKPEWTGPYGPNAHFVQSAIGCAGSCLKTCGRMECMAELTPDRVWKAVRAHLDEVLGSAA